MYQSPAPPRRARHGFHNRTSPLELTREVEFTSFAAPCIVGEIKRFFRDTSWAVHVPRSPQEARVQLARANEELFPHLAPMIAELDERDRQIIHWRFVDELTQARIGERLGVSQTHVSRLITRLLARLRGCMLSTH